MYGDLSTYLTLLTALATLFIAILTYISTKHMRNSIRASIFQRAIENMGVLEDVSNLRGLIKRVLWDREKGSVRRLAIPKDYENKYSFSDTNRKKIRLAEAVGRVSASLDRSACLMISFLKRKELLHLLNIFGDVFIDYWALCFYYIEYEQRSGRYYDLDSRMYFELMAYISIRYFQNQKPSRGCLTSFLYDDSDVSRNNEDLLERMRNREPLLQKRLYRSKFYKFKKGNL